MHLFWPFSHLPRCARLLRAVERCTHGLPCILPDMVLALFTTSAGIFPGGNKQKTTGGAQGVRGGTPELKVVHEKSQDLGRGKQVKAQASSLPPRCYINRFH